MHLHRTIPLFPYHVHILCVDGRVYSVRVGNLEHRTPIRSEVALHDALHDFRSCEHLPDHPAREPAEFKQATVRLHMQNTNHDWWTRTATCRQVQGIIHICTSFQTPIIPLKKPLPLHMIFLPDPPPPSVPQASQEL